MTPNFSVSRSDMRVIEQIIDRYEPIYEEAAGNRLDRLTLMMDLCVTHNNCPLKLQELLDGANADFVHDIAGIQRHINRRTGQLEDCFLPRYADLHKG